MKKNILGTHRRALCSAAIALSVALFSLPADAADKLTLLLPGKGYTPDILKSFEQETGIQVEQQTLAWDQLHTRIITALVANTSPADVIELDWSWVGQFGAAGWLEPLDGKLEQTAIDQVSVLPIFKFGGKVVGAPYNNDFKMMVVNADHLKKAGIDKAPRTMDELLAAGRAIKEKGVAKYPFGLPLSVGEATSTAWYLLAMMYGGTLFDDKGEPAFTDPSSGGYKALAFIKQAIDEGLIDPASTAYGNPEVREAFKAGDISFILSDGPGPLATYNDKEKSRVAGNIVGAVVPNVSGQTVTYGLPEALAIPAKSQNKDNAIKFINYILKQDVQELYYQQEGNLPTRQDALSALNKQGKLESGDAIVEQVASVKPLFAEGTPAWYPPFSSAAASAVNAVATGQSTVEAAAAAIAAGAKSAKDE
ncbi:MULTISPECIES: ABC transporter substrate-binding protein [unclassified Rhizobium]|uniref:ABC transporter substrate-binding protein n=1 Tax=unclassified Rhizobium TaxID=2613769 RepID=UPI001ADA9A09|nr:MULTISPECIES: sugar ABC transporter substrate-binding protein [unclassified Rhizobium]MBO9127294.1 sugar ABC transporter substrate-binding protein [Rhizobium sp. 16-488-2b]MBO9177737.1 sugar ABC transporter substrate-binding protein [Rhizobium sp. 16-488-2a]